MKGSDNSANANPPNLHIYSNPNYLAKDTILTQINPNEVLYCDGPYRKFKFISTMCKWILSACGLTFIFGFVCVVSIVFGERLRKIEKELETIRIERESSYHKIVKLHTKESQQNTNLLQPSPSSIKESFLSIEELCAELKEFCPVSLQQEQVKNSSTEFSEQDGLTLLHARGPGLMDRNSERIKLNRIPKSKRTSGKYVYHKSWRNGIALNPSVNTKILNNSVNPGKIQIKQSWHVGPLSNFILSDETDRSEQGKCKLFAIGKPVFLGEAKSKGSWMKETYSASHIQTKNTPESEKYWATEPEYPNMLFEYYNETAFTSNKNSDSPIKYNFNPDFQGNFHAVFNGSFYFVAKGKDANEPLRIIRFNIEKRTRIGKALELIYSSSSAGTLYSSGESKVDLSVDENGLWAIYTLPDRTNTAIVKIEVSQDDMDIVYGWNITINHEKVGDMFIICGILYAVESVTEQETKIKLAFDLYKRQLLKIDIPFINPFSKTSMISYNPKSQELLTIDNGSLLIYPVKNVALI